MATSTRFDKFLQNITATSTDRADASMRAGNAASKLHSHYYTTTYSGSTLRIIGGYGKGTAARPPRDVDILFMPPNSVYHRFDGYSGNGQSALLQEMREVLKSRYPNTNIRGDGQVVVVTFTDGHAVEVLPAWKTDSGKYLVPNTHDGGSWNLVDHDAEIKNIADSDARSNGNTRNLIRMMKTWQDYCSVPIKSLALELRARNFLSTWEYYEKGTAYYDWMVRDFFGGLIKNAGNYCTIPGIEERCYYGDAWLSRAETAYSRAVKACDFESSSSDTDAAIEWRKIFGDKYGF